jgi:hypothetical protein
MGLLLLVLLPALAAALAYLVPSLRVRLGILVGTAAVHFGAVVRLWVGPVAPELSGWLAIDSLGLLVLSLVACCFWSSPSAVRFLGPSLPRGSRVSAAPVVRQRWSP